VESSAVAGGGSILAPIVSLAMGARGFRDNVPGSVVGIGEGVRGAGAQKGAGVAAAKGAMKWRTGLQTRRRKVRRLPTKTRRQN